MAFVNREMDFGEFMQQLEERVKATNNIGAQVFFQSFLRESLPRELKRRVVRGWNGVVNAGDFDTIYPMACNILHTAATASASDAHPGIYKEADAVSKVFSSYLNELFQCSGDDMFDHLSITSYSEMAANAGLVEIKDGMVSLTPSGEFAVQKVEDQIRGLSTDQN